MMILNKLFFISLLKISFIWLILYLLILLLDQIRKKNNKKFNKESLKKSPALAQIYFDQFYITNIYYTFVLTFIYIFSMTVVFILIRYLAIGDIVNILPQGNFYVSFLNIFSVYIILFITILLYRTLMTMLCIKEVNKLYIYLKHYEWFSCIFEGWVTFKFIDNILGSLYLITYRIATLTYKAQMYPIPWNEDVNYDYLIDNDDDYVIRNKKIIACAYKLKFLAQDYFLIKNFFKILAYIFRFLFKHNRNINKPLPYFILISIFLIDLYNKEFNNIYLISFIYIIVTTKRDFVLFFESRDYISTITLAKYFYANSLDYKKQRINFYLNNQINIEPIVSSNENYDLFNFSSNSYFTRIIECSFNNFIYEASPNEKHNLYKKRLTGIYRRFLILIAFIFINYYLWFNVSIQMDIMVQLILLLPLILMIYSHCNTFYVKQYVEEILAEEFQYNRIYNIIFWLTAIFQTYIFWILLLKAQITFMDTNILWNIGIKIIKIYTVDEKMIYLYQYFEYCLTAGGSVPPAEQDYLRYLIRTIDFKPLIDNNIGLKDIQIYIKLFIENYTYIDIFYKHNNQEILWEEANSILTKNPWYILIKNTLFIGAITSIIIYSKNIYLVAKITCSPYNIYLTGSKICVMLYKILLDIKE